MLKKFYLITNKQPPWMQWMLHRAGFKDEFERKELTPLLNLVGAVCTSLRGLERRGLLDVTFTNEDEGPIFKFKGADILNEFIKIS